MVIVNETAAVWQISAVAGQRSAGSWRILPGATLEVELPAGDLQLRQVLLADGSSPGDERVLPVQLVAGERYHWTLATLLSASPEEITIPVAPTGMP